MQERAHRVVGVDAADALDGGLGDRLPIRDDRERLERRRREADRVRADVARDQGARLGGGRELDAVAVEHEPDAPLAAATPRGRRGGRPRSPGPCRRARRSRVATAAARRRTGAPRGRPRSARSAGVPRATPRPPSGRARRAVRRPRRRRPASAPRSRERLQGLVDGRLVGVRVESGRRPLLGRRGARDDRPPRHLLRHDDLASLHELEHREERDRDDDAVADAGEQVLQHERRRVAQGRADDLGTLGERHRPRAGPRAGARAAARGPPADPARGRGAPGPAAARRAAAPRPRPSHGPHRAPAGTARPGRGPSRPAGGRRRDAPDTG